MKQLTVFFTSDLHGYFSPIDYADGSRISSGAACCFAGFAKDGNTLIIDGGDTLQGSPFTYYLHKTGNEENLPARVMRVAGYDFITLGNHDFNYGLEVLQQYIDNCGARCLCANVKGLAHVEKYALITLENGLKVGLTGITTHYINIWEQPENLEGITITPPIPAAAAALEELKAAGAELTVCIYHGGIENDLVTGLPLSDTDENQGWRICKELDFDLLLSGHQHCAIENLDLFGTHVCQPPDHGRAYLCVTAYPRSEGGRIESHLCYPGPLPLPAAEALLAPWEEQAAQWLDRPVGHLNTSLQPRGYLDMAINGSTIANFFNQVQLAASGADISAASLANEVKGFQPDVSIRDVVATYIYPNTLVTLEVDRRVLKTALERCAEYFDLDINGEPVISDRFLKPKVEHYNYDYFSGIEVTFDLRRPIGDRVTSIRRNGEELPDDRSYTLCMNDYRASGTGGYNIYRSCRRISGPPTEIAELIMDYISVNGNISVDLEKHLEVLY